MKPESDEDLRREQKAITTFCSLFGGKFKKLDPTDVDYRVFDKNDQLIAYVEVTERNMSIKQAFPLCITAHKLSKLCDKRLNPVLVWSCDDGIIYVKPAEVTGEIKFAPPIHLNLFADKELMVFYECQKPFKYVRYQ